MAEKTATTNIGGRVTKEKVSITGGAWRLLSFMIFVFSVFFMSYLGLTLGYRTYLEAQINKKDQELNDLASQVSKEKQDEFLRLAFQLINLKDVLSKHVAARKILPFLEDTVNSVVFYRNLDLDVSTGRASFRAAAPSYEVLAEQLAAYQSQSQIARYQVTSARIGEGGKIDFNMVLYLKPEIFKF